MPLCVFGMRALSRGISGVAVGNRKDAVLVNPKKVKSDGQHWKSFLLFAHLPWWLANSAWDIVPCGWKWLSQGSCPQIQKSMHSCAGSIHLAFCYEIARFGYRICQSGFGTDKFCCVGEYHQDIGFIMLSFLARLSWILLWNWVCWVEMHLVWYFSTCYWNQIQCISLWSTQTWESLSLVEVSIMEIQLENVGGSLFI